MRTKHFIIPALLAAILFISPRLSMGQGFGKGSTLLGPHVGLAAFSSAPLFGANLEIGVTEPGKAGPGIIGVGGRVDYFSYSYDYGFGTGDSWKYTWIVAGVFGNYHFALDDKTWDPF